MTGGTLIVGAGEAAIQLAVSLRQRGDDGPITVVGSEAHQPYQRPPLSKAYLAGKASPASLELRTPEFYRDQRIDVVVGTRIERIVRAASGGGGVAIAAGRQFPFDALALAVGARSRRLTRPGSDLAGIFTLRDLDEAIGLRAALRASERIVVVGGGYIGLETAAVARAAGKQVTVIEAADRLASRSVPPTVSAFLRAAHMRRGVDIGLSSQVDRFEGVDGRLTEVVLTDGTAIRADLALVAIGVLPRTELADQLGLTCDGGIVVDDFARTSDPAVVAVGDCTVMPNPMTGQGRVRLESSPNAIAQAKVAAATLSGVLEPYRSVPWFWSEQYDFMLQTVGLADSFDHEIVRGDPADEAFSVLYYRQGNLVAVNAVNRAADYVVARQVLSRGASIDPERAGELAVALRDLITDRAPLTQIAQ